MSLPNDIIRLISLLVRPHLFSINKDLITLYDDIWYQDKLQLLYPNKLYTATNYQDLYKKYLKMGDIYTIYGNEPPVKLSTKGIKAVGWHFPSGNFHHILDFNGNLYLEDNNNIKIIDTEVIDIDTKIYIKKDYIMIFNDTWIKIPLIGNPIKVKCYVGLYYVLTSEYIYQIYDKYTQPTKSLVNKDFIDMIISFVCIYLVNENYESYQIDSSLTGPISKSQFIFKPNMGLFDKNDNVVFVRYVNNYISDIKDKNIKHDWIDGKKLMLKDKTFQLQYDNIGVKMTISNVKDFYGNCNGIYIIKDSN